MGTVVALQKMTPRKRETTAARMPERFDAHDAELLLRWCMDHGFKYEELIFAVQAVRDWSESRANAPLKRSWVKTIEQAMRSGWALRGYRQSRQRNGGTINPRTGTPILPGEREITEELIAKHLAKLRGDA